MDVGLEPGFLCHTGSVEQTVSIEFILIAVSGCHCTVAAHAHRLIGALLLLGFLSFVMLYQNVFLIGR